MLHPSYNELINKVNEESEDNEPVIQSMYSIVIAAAKRARQLIDGDAPIMEMKMADDVAKPLSTAVEELYKGEVHILGEEDIDENDIKDV